jgi:Acetyltransferases
MRYVVRQLDTPKQGHELEVIARIHHAETGGKREFHEDGVLEYCKRYGPQRVRSELTCWLAYTHYTEVEKERECVGYLLAKISQPYGSVRRFSYVEHVYTLPEHRNILVFSALLRKFDEWSMENNCERQHLCVEYDDDELGALKQLRLYERLGYKRCGYITAKYVDYSSNSGNKDEVA